MKRRSLTAFALGAATVAGFAPLGIFPLPFLTLAYLFHLWRQAASSRQGALLGFAWGLGFFLTGVSWVYVSLNEFGGMAPPIATLATLLFCMTLAALPALAGGSFVRWRRGTPWADALLAAGLWTLTEWLRGWIFTGFPWLSIGYAQTPPSPLAGYAPILGVYGITLAVAFGAAVFASGCGKLRAVLVLAAIVAIGFLLRQIEWTQPVGAPIRVSLLQGNISQKLKWDPQRLPLSLRTYVSLAQEHPADLTVLPETALPLFFDELPRALLHDLTTHGPVLFGVVLQTRAGGYTNGAVVVVRKGEDDFAVQGYAKRHLVPFGEYGPSGFGWFFDLVSIPMSDFTAGAAHQPPLAIAGQKIAANICYEDAFGAEIIDALPEATLLVNLSNTAWFGDSLAQPQHLQISRLRAIETGRPNLRATNTGMTAFIAPDGSVTAVLDPFTTGALVVSVQGYAGVTPYVRYGNTAAVMLALFALLISLSCRRPTLPATEPALPTNAE